jgi:antitoxin component YwqK of YwqJK toxin-antitoxin module
LTKTENDKINDVYKSYHRNGQLEEEINYIDDIPKN